MKKNIIGSEEQRVSLEETESGKHLEVIVSDNDKINNQEWGS